MFVCSFTLNAKIAEDDGDDVERASETDRGRRSSSDRVPFGEKGEEAEEGKICIAFGRSLLERREMDQGISEHWQYLQYRVTDHGGHAPGLG